jgi:hypothetical protein
MPDVRARSDSTYLSEPHGTVISGGVNRPALSRDN